MNVRLLGNDRECSACENRCPYNAITYDFSKTEYTMIPQIDPQMPRLRGLRSRLPDPARQSNRGRATVSRFGELAERRRGPPHDIWLALPRNVCKSSERTLQRQAITRAAGGDG